jgi:hypothetical protein
LLWAIPLASTVNWAWYMLDTNRLSLESWDQSE